MDEVSSILSKVPAELREMDKAEAEREDARFEKLLEHNRKMMERQERLQREATENERMLFEMLLSRLPFQTPQHVNGTSRTSAPSSNPTTHGDKRRRHL